MTTNSFGAKQTLAVGDSTFEIFDLASSGADLPSLPYSIRILLENLLRNEDGENITAEDIRAVVDYDPSVEPSEEILFTPARVLLQDFTGVPAVVDLAVMRDAVADLGGDPDVINPRVPVDLVIDHSIQVDTFAVPDAFRKNAEIEFQRNYERYQFLRWGQTAFDNFRVVPPNTGIVHQVNLEYLGQVVFRGPDGQAYPDSLVGTDSHTPMINGLGIVGWGVGGIEAEAAMLGQPISMLIPQVVGFELTGELSEGATATDMVLTVTEMLREKGVVGKFVEFFGEGVGSVPIPDRATLGNMSPEFGSTISIFPIDQRTLDYMDFTGRDADQIALVEAYAKHQGLWHDPDNRPDYTDTLTLDLSTVVPSLAGPTRPQDRVPLTQAQQGLREVLPQWTGEVAAHDPAGAEAELDSFPASDAPTTSGERDDDPPVQVAKANGLPDRVTSPTPVVMASGEQFELDHGDVVIAAITSCTNTSNPSVMIGAGLLAKKAVEKGLARKPWVKTSLAPGSKVVTDYYERADLMPYLEKLGFHLVGYGCTTCIGNSGPLPQEISRAINEHNLAAVSVLSGNRNFEGRIGPDVKLNYLASPPLVVAYALAGTMDIDLYNDPIGQDPDGNDVFMADIWPSNAEIQQVVQDAVKQQQFVERYADVFTGDEQWRNVPVSGGNRFEWSEESTYIQKPTFFDGMGPEPPALSDIQGARVLVKVGDSVTTDHISPAGAIKRDSPAGQYLIDKGVEIKDFNSYGSRRGNHEVMMRGTFGNIRLRNQMAPGTEGGFTTKQSGEGAGEVTTIYDAAMSYIEEETPLVVLAGEEYGTGSSRDWAAKGTILLGVRAVIAKSYERIHRSNLIGMGVLPLQFKPGEGHEELGLTGEESFTITGVAGGGAGPEGRGDAVPEEVQVQAGDKTFTVDVRLDTPNEQAYYRHGGILHYVLRQLAEG